MDQEVTALGIAGSLREGSYNRAVIRAAREVAPDGLEIDLFDNELLKQIPLYNEDVRTLGDPAPVIALKETIAGADALVIAAPEYNHSVAGVLKNALDRASRPPDATPLEGKPVAIMAASRGAFGTVRAQVHMREFCVYNNMLALNEPQVLEGRAHRKFDESGELHDETARTFVRDQMEGLLRWARRIQADPAGAAQELRGKDEG